MVNGNPTTDEWYYRKQGGDRYFAFGPFTWEKLFILYIKGQQGDVRSKVNKSTPQIPFALFTKAPRRAGTLAGILSNQHRGLTEIHTQNPLQLQAQG